LSLGRELADALLGRNPLLGGALGLCPALAVSTSLKNGVGIGLATAAVVVGSVALAALVGRALPARARMLALVVVTAGLATAADVIMTKHMPTLRAGLGIYVPLIATNCIVFGDARAAAQGAGLVRSLVSGLGAGLGFAGAVVVVSAIREVAGSGKLWDVAVAGPNFNPALMLTIAPGGLIALGLVMGVFNRLRHRS